MSLVNRDGERVALPRVGRCPTGRIARIYLRRAASPTEERERTRRLLTFGGHSSWGLTLERIARAFGRSKQQLSRELPETLAELREIARSMGLNETALFHDQETFDAGSGI